MLSSTLYQDNLVAIVVDEAHVARVWLLTSTSSFITTSAQFEATEPVRNIHHNQTLCDVCTPPTKQSDAAEFGITNIACKTC